jgi:hypothetical protein
MTNLEDILERFASGYRRCSVDNSGDAFECVCEITPDEVLYDSDVDLVVVLGVRLPQRVSLSRPRDSNEAFNTAINQRMTDLLTLERDSPLLRGVPKRAHQRSQTRQ